MESTRCIVRLLNKVQLCLSGCLTKEYCIGIYIVAKWIRMMSRKAGWLSFNRVILKMLRGSLNARCEYGRAALISICL